MAAIGFMRSRRALDRYRKETGKTPEQLTGGWRLAYDRIYDKDAGAIAQVKKYQWRDGTLSTGFFTSAGGAHDLKSRMYAAGHTLEFLVAALSPNELQEPWVVLAVERLLDEFAETKSLDVECGTLYHAAHALKLYRQACWRIAGPSPPVLAGCLSSEAGTMKQSKHVKQFRTPLEIPAGCLVAPTRLLRASSCAKPVGQFDSDVYYNRKDVSELKSKDEWHKLGRKVKARQEPLAERGVPEPLALFAEWQTQ